MCKGAFWQLQADDRVYLPETWPLHSQAEAEVTWGWRKDHGRCNRDKAHRSIAVTQSTPFVKKPMEIRHFLAGGFIAGHASWPDFAAACVRHMTSTFG
jgi:hypothetical protein